MNDDTEYLTIGWDTKIYDKGKLIKETTFNYRIYNEKYKGEIKK